MGFEDIRLVIESRMAAWVDAPIHFDGTKTPDPDDPTDKRPVTNAIRAKEPWVRLTINHGQSSVAALGSRPEVRRTGLIQVQVFTAENQGSRPAALLADHLADHLQYYAVDKLETLAASVQRVGPSGGWFQYNVTLPFRAG